MKLSFGHMADTLNSNRIIQPSWTNSITLKTS
jgi:hypothetical protein